MGIKLQAPMDILKMCKDFNLLQIRIFANFYNMYDYIGSVMCYQFWVLDYWLIGILIKKLCWYTTPIGSIWLLVLTVINVKFHIL